MTCLCAFERCATDKDTHSSRLFVFFFYIYFLSEHFQWWYECADERFNSFSSITFSWWQTGLLFFSSLVIRICVLLVLDAKITFYHYFSCIFGQSAIEIICIRQIKGNFLTHTHTYTYDTTQHNGLYIRWHFSYSINISPLPLQRIFWLNTHSHFDCIHTYTAA